jgi:predicted nucleic acid-binding protein
VDELMLDRAGDLAPTGVSSLDAVHLATALALGTEMGVLFTYDGRFREAAESCGLTVAAPERPR